MGGGFFVELDRLVGAAEVFVVACRPVEGGADFVAAGAEDDEAHGDERREGVVAALAFEADFDDGPIVAPLAAARLAALIDELLGLGVAVGLDGVHRAGAEALLGRGIGLRLGRGLGEGERRAEEDGCKCCHGIIICRRANAVQNLGVGRISIARVWCWGHVGLRIDVAWLAMRENEMELQSLDGVLTLVWSMLGRAVTVPSDVMRFVQLATTDEEDGCDVRTVVLRGVDSEARRLTCYSDRRCRKVGQIGADGRTVWHAYHPTERIQLRMYATAAIEGSNVAIERAWAELSDVQRREYGANAVPGGCVDSAGHGGVGKEADARAHFAVIVAVVHRIDWLRLDEAGHLRARFVWNESGALAADWIAP